ncbi:uncharacterized protein B0I36DRAFT_13212 [Microdochium trichocladiopsis]|uniref:Uncharacterized protein n=1 Tax=Microdochium trichocladiopsis TaxID=1682393 RepID=A0A9P8YII2_9PEZI|nr:uncharacterized protein B0I36DRAFT_13212 [Microdochium trichocladiopsis]KAH7040627.1 hypothetical protein B0I36DRAFT_13212 [Microdochium trichocladiopsis]
MSATHSNAPPPYSAASKSNHINHNSSPPPPPPQQQQQQRQQQPIINPNSTTYHLRNHVSSLPSRIRDSHNARANRHASDDSALLEETLVPHVEAFLADLGSRPVAPPSATLVLYPTAAMLLGNSFDSISGFGAEAETGRARPRTPKLSGLDDMQRHGEFVRVQGVESSSSSLSEPKPGNDKPGLYGHGFGDGKGGSGSREKDLLWWKDEAMARRLAAYIQPKPEEDPNLAPPAFFDADVARHEHQQQEQAGAKKSKDKKSWGLKKFIGGGGGSRSPPAARGYAVQSINASELDTRAKMTVKAEEMTFRVENDMGLYESFNGWALVARVTFLHGEGDL